MTQSDPLHPSLPRLPDLGGVRKSLGVPAGGPRVGSGLGVGLSTSDKKYCLLERSNVGNGEG